MANCIYRGLDNRSWFEARKQQLLTELYLMSFKP